MNESAARLRPKVFVGSSSEARELALAVQENLCADADVTVWSQEVCAPGDVLIDSLRKAIIDNDYGIFIFSPDDRTRIRNKTLESVRDNVLFELGLFMGRRGRDRCFFIVPGDQSKFRLPSDLIGINTATYDGGRASTNPSAALGPACTQIRRVLNERWGRGAAERGRSRNLPLGDAFSEFARYNTNHPLTLVRTTVINGKDDVDLEIVGVSDRARDLFMIRSDEEAPVGFHMDDIYRQFEPFVDRDDLERYKVDQRRIRRAYSRGEYAVAEVAVRFNKNHGIFPNKVFFPLAIAYGGEIKRRAKASLAVIMYLDLGFLPGTGDPHIRTERSLAGARRRRAGPS